MDKTPIAAGEGAGAGERPGRGTLISAEAVVRHHSPRVPADSTRVISLWIGSRDRTGIDGVNIAHHDASHHGREPTKLEQLSLIEEAEVKAAPASSSPN